MAQSVEHILGKDEVGGSSPLSSSKKTTIFGGFLFYLFFDLSVIAVQIGTNSLDKSFFRRNLGVLCYFSAYGSSVKL